MKLLRRLYSKHDIGDPVTAAAADVLLVVAIVAGVLFLIYFVEQAV